MLFGKNFLESHLSNFVLSHYPEDNVDVVFVSQCCTFEAMVFSRIRSYLRLRQITQFTVLLLAVLCGFVWYKIPPLPFQPVGVRFLGQSHVFGHNGGGHLAPENSIVSLQLCCV